MSDHADKGYSEEKCVRCCWVMGQPALNCNNDNTPHVFPSQVAALDALIAERDAETVRADVNERHALSLQEAIEAAEAERDEARQMCDDAVNHLRVRAEAAEARITELEAALAVYADHRHWGIEREFRYPRAVWIGPGADQTVPDAPGVARAALAAPTKEKKA